jgi:2'-5' RNA ligase
MFGITLRTASNADPFWQLVDRASALEPSPSIRALGYPPHITLTRYSEIAPDLILGVARAFDGAKVLSLTFDRMGIFDGDPLVLWLSPRRDQRLVDLHTNVHQIIDPALCDPHYQPRQWTPHLTIAMSIPPDQRARALELAARPIEPFSLTFDAVECVSWPPVRVLRTTTLTG